MTENTGDAGKAGEVQLLPCPFCGGADLSTIYHDIDGWMAYIQCNRCDGEVHGPDSEYKYDDKDEASVDASAQWNIRAALYPPVEQAPQPVAWRWVWKTTGSELEQRFADPDLYEWAYRHTPPSVEAAEKMVVEPLYARPAPTEAPPVEPPARLSALEAENARLREALDQISEMENWKIGVPADTEAANEHARIAQSMVEAARAALSTKGEA